MSLEPDHSLTGKIIGVAKDQAPSALQGFEALTSIVDAAREVAEIHEVEKTKRTQIRAIEHMEVSRIKAAESVLKAYFDSAFAERREVFEGLFERMDRALDSGDPRMVTEVVNAVVDVAKKSPLADLGDLGQIRAALGDPDHVWEL
ncbi:hypothetical protein [Gordonia sp. (in: high G+C Gram-positive bacteria)]|uniref:hypothetical protein n=1 Tax=Gordonia sp. (in: high G+C Gram-positive bacteria) TaxID=84139 RepID=UPI003C76B9D7